MKILFVFGTRPEAIKMAPIIMQANRRNIDTVIAVTAQHRQMLDSVLSIFEIKPDYDLNIFKEAQSLTDITTNSLIGLEGILKRESPDIVLVQGDTTTVFAAALSAFYQKIPIGHVEAGLRSHNLMSPYPEEANRKLTSVISSFHFAPTEKNRENLLREGHRAENIFVTGNTVIDALKYATKKEYSLGELDNLPWDNTFLLTAHRRENQGKPMENIFRAISDTLDLRPEIHAVFPIHLNPVVRNIAKKYFEGKKNMHIIEPLDYLPFSNLMNRVKFVMTDSGGIQEEAPSLGKPVLVIREETERMEGITSNTAKLIGTSYKSVYENLNELICDKTLYQEMQRAVNPYGDGRAASYILDAIEHLYKEKEDL